MKDAASHMLRQNALSVTDSRRRILDLFLGQNSGALRHSDVEQAMSDIDRVTIYRTLQVFTEKGILHGVPGTDGTLRYALCKGGCTDGLHVDNHVHFVCTHCHSTQCLDDVHVPSVKLPVGFEATKTEMVVSGICSKCRS